MANKREWLIKLRGQVGFTQQKVIDEAKLLNESADISRSTYAQYESGRRTPSVENAQLIAKVLGFEWTIFFANSSGVKPQRKSA